MEGACPFPVQLPPFDSHHLLLKASFSSTLRGSLTAKMALSKASQFLGLLRATFSSLAAGLGPAFLNDH